MPENSPWKTLTEGGARAGGRGKRFLRKEIDAGRLRAVRIGGRREYFVRDEWIDEWMLDHPAPIAISTRRRA